jgi:acyl-CoA synthetase (AMP-forming)/AMP-acid ligase II
MSDNSESGITNAAQRTPDRVAVADGRGRQLTFAELEEVHRRIAGSLLADGIEEGDRIGVMSSNSLEVLSVMVAALRAGIVPVPVSPLLTSSEITYLMADSGAKFLTVGGDHEVDVKVPVIDLAAWARRSGSPAEIAGHIRGRPMHYTSGTTGKPKGVWVDPCSAAEARRRSDSFCTDWGIVADDVHLVCSPLTHSAPLRYAVRTLEAGGRVVLQDRFDAVDTLTRMQRHSITSTFVVPTHLERIFALDNEARSHDVSAMRLLAHAGAPIRPETKRRAIEFFPPGSVWEFYGSTEGGFTIISPDEWLEHPYSVGRARPGAELFITGEDGGELVVGSVGQIWVRDPQADRFIYWNDPDKTSETWSDGAYSVNDLGHVDTEGYLYLAGRGDDTIISGGVNVYPKEIELTLMDHPDVAEAIVFGVDTPEWGQEVRARVVVTGDVDAEALRAWARQRLAGYKTPRIIEIVDELPRTTTGKLKRRF